MRGIMRKASALRKKAVTFMAAAAAAGVTGVTLTETQAQPIAQASWLALPGNEVVIDMVIDAPLAEGDVVTLKFPEDVALADTSVFATMSTQDTPLRVNTPRAHTITLTCDTAALVPGHVRIRLDEVFATAPAATMTYTIALEVDGANGMPRLYGAALPQQGIETRVSASVALAATIGVSTNAVRLGTLSPQRVAQGRQTYYIHSNNASGVRVYLASDGPLRSATGDVIGDVADGAVTVGAREYGVTVENVRNVSISEAFVVGDVAVPRVNSAVSNSPAPVESGSFDLVYKASIDSNTPVGNYSQTVFFTIMPNI